MVQDLIEPMLIDPYQSELVLIMLNPDAPK
jgi:hypothetical protein